MARDSDNFKPLVVRQDPDDKVTGEVLASAIRDIAESMRRLEESLTEEAIVLLVTNAIPTSYGISQKSVRAVLLGIGNLEKKYVKGPRR